METPQRRNYFILLSTIIKGLANETNWEIVTEQIPQRHSVTKTFQVNGGRALHFTPSLKLYLFSLTSSPSKYLQD